MFNFFKPIKKFNLIILGAQKAGTTSLHNTLSKHPEIFMTNPIKEPGYFLPIEVMKAYYLKKGIKIKSQEHYIRLLAKGARNEKYFGESSTFYTTVEWSNKMTAQKMYGYNPDLKFIFITRNRVERIISHYKHECKKNKQLLFEDFLENEEAFGISMYHQRLKPFFSTFPRENFCIINFEELVSNSEMVLNKVFDFLDIARKVDLKLEHLNQSANLLSEEKINLIKTVQQKTMFQQIEADKEQFIAFLSES